MCAPWRAALLCCAQGLFLVTSLVSLYYYYSHLPAKVKRAGQRSLFLRDDDDEDDFCASRWCVERRGGEGRGLRRRVEKCVETACTSEFITIDYRPPKAYACVLQPLPPPLERDEERLCNDQCVRSAPLLPSRPPSPSLPFPWPLPFLVGSFCYSGFPSFFFRSLSLPLSLSLSLSSSSFFFLPFCVSFPKSVFVPIARRLRTLTYRVCTCAIRLLRSQRMALTFAFTTLPSAGVSCSWGWRRRLRTR